MGKRKVSILSKASEELAYIAYFIESKGLPETAKSLYLMHLNFLKHYPIID
jgi:hypothetical protein